MTDHERLSRELRSRADGTGGHPISLDDVKRSATKMKWQQRAAAGGVAAVVLAIGVPVGINLANNGTTKNTEPPVATQAPEPTTPTPTPAAPTGTAELTLSGASRGADAQVSWLQGKTVHLYDGSTATLPKETYQDVVAYRGGWLATYMNSDGYMIDRIDAEGTVTSSEWGGVSIAESLDGTEIAWAVGTKNDYTIHFGIPSGASDDEPSAAPPEGTPVNVVGFAGAGEVVYEPYYYESDGNQPEYAAIIDSAGNHRSFDGVLKVGGVSQTSGVLAVQTSFSDDGSCWDVRSADDGKVAWKTCEYSLSHFSADGKYLIAYDAYQDGLGPRNVYVLDSRNGKELVHYTGTEQTGAFLGDVVWDGDSNDLVASVYEQGSWQLARLSLDGSIETVTDAVPAEDIDNPFRLMER